MYWRIRYETSLVDGADYRTVVVYKDSQETVKIDPHPAEWTGTFRDDRPINPLRGWPENELTGTIFTVNAWRHDALEVTQPRRVFSCGFGLLLDCSLLASRLLVSSGF